MEKNWITILRMQFQYWKLIFLDKVKIQKHQKYGKLIFIILSFYNAYFAIFNRHCHFVSTL